jgi:hypothetical protein
VLTVAFSAPFALLVSGERVRAQVPSPTPTASASPEQAFDHLKCFPIRDGLRQQLFTADLVPEDSDIFTTENGDRIEDGKLKPGCRIRVPARELCIPVSKENAHEVNTDVPPPGAEAGPNAGEFACYLLRCPKDNVKEHLNISDQFGTRPIEVLDRPSKLCAPVTRGTPTPTPSVTPTGSPTSSPTSSPTATPTSTPVGTPTSTPVGTPTSTPVGTPTSTPVGTPTATPTETPTPTPGSPSGAFLDSSVNY